ncbi:hypothetical protein H5410_041104 [Solanum commersonii]|uniref:Uncharacterized protein n=1 Tax=Solanum commersonii TaxID=4109 RepID=A0A9J5XUH9_SOLCO|nr:hypothetical protein H5410_041104 [Solanum commersonii]
MWRVWHKRILIREVLVRMRITDYSLEVLCRCSRIQGPFVKVRQAIEVWWKVKCVIKFKSLCKVTPAFIIWHIWKRRNLIRHGSNMTTRAMIMGITRQLVLFANLLSRWMRINLIHPFGHKK